MEAYILTIIILKHLFPLRIDDGNLVGIPSWKLDLNEGTNYDSLDNR